MAQLTGKNPAGQTDQHHAAILWTMDFPARKFAPMNPAFSRLATGFLALAATASGFGAGNAPAPADASRLASPDGRLAVVFHLNADGAPRYAIQLDARPVLQESRLGLVRDDADFSRGLQLMSESRTERVRDKYEILTAKRRVNDYRANRKVFHLQTAASQKLDIIFQVSNDGVAFRYFFPETNAALHRLTEEVSSFHFLPETRAWLQPIATK